MEAVRLAQGEPHQASTADQPGSGAVIKSIEIENLRGIRQGKLEDLTPLVVLKGPNGCGKSREPDAC